MKRTRIQQWFGEDKTYKTLTKEERTIYRRVLTYIRYLSMTDEERKELFRKRMEKYRKNNAEKYRKDQREYRKKRIAQDPEFKERVNRHTSNWYKKQKENK